VTSRNTTGAIIDRDAVRFFKIWTCGTGGGGRLEPATEGGRGAEGLDPGGCGGGFGRPIGGGGGLPASGRGLPGGGGGLGRPWGGAARGGLG